MKKLFLLGIMGMNCWFTYAQLRTTIDSLGQKLEDSPKDTSQVRVLLDMANAYRGINLDTSYLFAKKAYNLASSLNDDFGRASADKIKGTYFLYTGQMDSSIFYYQKGQKRFKSLGDLDGVHDINYNLGLLHASISEYDKAISYYREDFEYRNQIGDTLGIADGYLNMGAVYLYQGKNQEAYKNLTASVPYFTQAGDYLSVAKVNFNLGTIQWNFSNYDLALNDFFSSLEVFEKEEDHYLLASCTENIAGVYENMGNYRNALKYYRRSLHYSQTVGDSRLTTSNYHSLGAVMDKSAKKDSALYYFEKSLQLAEKGNFKDLQSLNYHSLGTLYAKEDMAKGVTFLNKSISLKESIDLDDFNVATSLYELGKIHTEQRQFSKAQKALEEGLEISRQTDSKDMRSKLSFALYQLYKKMGQQGRALGYLEQYDLLRDSIFSEETTKNIVAREIQYETAKKDQQIQLLEKEREVQDAEVVAQQALIEKRSTQRNLLLAGIGSIVLVSFLLFRNYRTKLKSRELINKKQQEFVNLRSRFFANISHEFRTPLTLILGPLRDFLAREPKKEERVQSYRLMQRSSEKLLDLVNQLLDLAKLESGNRPLQVRQGDLSIFLKTHTAAFSSLAHFQNIDYNMTISPELSLGWFDEDALEKMVNNLLSNAFKFTENGGKIDFSATLANANDMDLDDSVRRLKIKVSDSGRGIPDDELEKVFDRFHQGDGAGAHKTSGTGIGLALTKELIALHGGTISVESELGKGSTFTIMLPIDKECFDETAIVDGDKEVSKIGTVSKKSVPKPIVGEKTDGKTVGKDQPILLIVEDNDEVRTYVKKQLNDTYQVHEASDGIEGLGLAQKIVPDLIISDVMMPGMGGMALCERLKKDEKTSHIPVILLTALASQASKVEGIETGADDYIVKPFDKKELMVRVKNLIQQRQLLREKYRRQITLEPKTVAVTSADERFLTKAIQLLEKHLDDSEFGVEIFSKNLGMSRTQLFRKMRALTNQSPQDFIRDFRLQRAAQLLKSKAGNISEVAYQVGFNNLSYFTKRFKELFGKTPSEYAS
ncbi:tetratricopeptide repeat protein [Flagellimonas meishanensis]|uniref:tetratricopeptide repeat protein n=1 Tax=Flagellimonas meishanensis TaxID=2873264 RepID=UPI001CA682EC|nr:tetratricopeptide repeat protein [[Muricauda] meishanensis]